MNYKLIPFGTLYFVLSSLCGPPFMVAGYNITVCVVTAYGSRDVLGAGYLGHLTLHSVILIFCEGKRQNKYHFLL